MKKNNQINISLSDYEYSVIKTIAYHERRTLADVARLILIDNANELIKKYNQYEIAHFIPNKK